MPPSFQPHAGWREKLTENQLRLIDHNAGEVLLSAGYPLAFPSDAAHVEIAAQMEPAV